MTLAFSKAKVIYDGNGETVNWDIPFAFLSPDDIEVYVVQNGQKTKLLSSDYVLDTEHSRVIYPHPDGQTAALPSGDKLMILRHTPLTQTAAFAAQTALDPFVLEEGYDKAMMVAQELAERLDRAVIFPAEDTSGPRNAQQYMDQVDGICQSAKTEINTVKVQTQADLSQAVSEAQSANQIAQQSLSVAQQAAQTAQTAAQQAQTATQALSSYVEQGEEARDEAVSAADLAVSNATQLASSAQSALSSASAAASSKESAAASAQTSVSKAQEALTSAAAANDSAASAAASQTAAVSAAELAQNWAVKMNGPVANELYSSKYYASKAAQSASAAETHLPLLFAQWSDHLFEDISWLRADTFSWQSGEVYTAVYNELLAQYNHADSVTETDGDISFKRTPKGYKICAASQHDNVSTAYAQKGAAWYYILDTENTRFKLPREKYAGYKKSAPVIGNGMAVGLTNGAKSAGLVQGIGSSAPSLGSMLTAYGQSVSSSGGVAGIEFSGSLLGLTNDPTKSGMIADLSNSPADMYLYFYVGNYTQEAIEQTAGLNAELFNGKQDKLPESVDYVVESYTDASGNWYRIYKSGWLEQGGTTTGTGNYGLKDITFLKPFSNTHYSFSSKILWYENPGWYTSSANASLCGITDVSGVGTQYTTTGCKVQTYSARDWYAFGQGAE